MSLDTRLSNRDFFFARWEQEYLVFLNVFRALPADRLDYRPHPRSRSAGELVALMVASQKNCIDLCKNYKSFYNGLRWHVPPGFDPLAEMIANYERDHEVLIQLLTVLDDTAWNHQAWLIQGTEEILLRATVGGLMWIALFDIVHHRGQLSTYIRPMGGKVPSIYGPSGDSPE